MKKQILVPLVLLAAMPLMAQQSGTNAPPQVNDDTNQSVVLQTNGGYVIQAGTTNVLQNAPAPGTPNPAPVPSISHTAPGVANPAMGVPNPAPGSPNTTPHVAINLGLPGNGGIYTNVDWNRNMTNEYGPTNNAVTNSATAHHWWHFW